MNNTNLQHIPLVVIGGPTAVGKTQLSIELAKRFDGEIINGDRMQCYRGLDIGTGKVTLEEMEGIPHHLLDNLAWEDTYDASQFKQAATEVIQSVWARGKLPILVGGSGLYLEGLLYHLEFGGEASHDPAVREALQTQLEVEGASALWHQLAAIDPQAASAIPVQNTRRLIRALEVIQTTGQLFSSQTRHATQASIFNECLLVLDRPRQQLYERINQRVAMMVDAGLEAEVRQLYQYTKGELWQSTQGIGYKEWWPYFAQTTPILSQADVISAIQQNSRRYAKRQLTWFRNRTQSAHWLDTQDMQQTYAAAVQLVATHLGVGQQ